MRLRQGLGVLAFLLVASALVSRLPSSEEVRNEPFERRVAVGQVVSLRGATYQVATVEGGRSVKGYRRDTLSTNGVFLVITIWHAGIDRPSNVDTPRVRDSHDRVFSGGIQPLEGLSSCTRGQPILGQTCQLVIEVAPDWLPGAELWIPSEWGVSGDHDEVAVIDLGITVEMVTAWLDPTTLVTVTGPRGGRP